MMEHGRGHNNIKTGRGNRQIADVSLYCNDLARGEVADAGDGTIQHRTAQINQCHIEAW